MGKKRKLPLHLRGLQKRIASPRSNKDRRIVARLIGATFYKNSKGKIVKLRKKK